RFRSERPGRIGEAAGGCRRLIENRDLPFAGGALCEIDVEQDFVSDAVIRKERGLRRRLGGCRIGRGQGGGRRHRRIGGQVGKQPPRRRRRGVEPRLRYVDLLQ